MNLGSRLVLTVVVVVGCFWWYSRKTDHAHAEVLAESRQLMTQVEGYAASAEYIDDLIGRAHELAFPGSYDPGRPRGRWSAGTAESFNDDKYLKALFLHMHILARKDRDSFNAEKARQIKDFLVNLDKLREKMGIEKPPGWGA